MYLNSKQQTIQIKTILIVPLSEKKIVTNIFFRCSYLSYIAQTKCLCNLYRVGGGIGKASSDTRYPSWMVPIPLLGSNLPSSTLDVFISFPALKRGNMITCESSSIRQLKSLRASLINICKAHWGRKSIRAKYN